MWDRLLALTGTVLLCLLENWLAKPFLSIAMEDFYIMPHSFSYSVLPRIAWGLMFELLPWFPQSQRAALDFTGRGDRQGVEKFHFPRVLMRTQPLPNQGLHLARELILIERC